LKIILRKYFKCAEFKIQMHAKMYLKYSSNYKYNIVFKIHCKVLNMYLKYALNTCILKLPING